jgi:hypothetical protein
MDGAWSRGAGEGGRLRAGARAATTACACRTREAECVQREATSWPLAVRVVWRSGGGTIKESCGCRFGRWWRCFTEPGGQGRHGRCHLGRVAAPAALATACSAASRPGRAPYSCALATPPTAASPHSPTLANGCRTLLESHLSHPVELLALQLHHGCRVHPSSHLSPSATTWSWHHPQPDIRCLHLTRLSSTPTPSRQVVRPGVRSSLPSTFAVVHLFRLEPLPEPGPTASPNPPLSPLCRGCGVSSRCVSNTAPSQVPFSSLYLTLLRAVALYFSSMLRDCFQTS